ncbi:MAG: M24 family metallopeptidase [Planctomycetes bacterium]|nr:M24 family metallopeptidase [Planctomycetota bacterium]
MHRPGTAEIDLKRDVLRDYLRHNGLDAVLLSSQALFSWYTGGLSNRVAMCTDGGAACLLASGIPGEDTIFTTNIEEPRLRDEELSPHLNLNLESFSWWEEDAIADRVRSLASGRKVVSDSPFAGLPSLPPDFLSLTYSLTAPEIDRYRSLGRDTSACLELVARRLEPGMTELTIAADISLEFLNRDIIPHVLLVAADERTLKYRHPLPTDRPVEKHVMLVACARRGGLIASITRLVHFGPLSKDLAARHHAVTAVDAALIAGTVENRPLSDIFNDAVSAYAAAGFPDEWRLHHQGGPTGYQSRSYKGTPSATQLVLANQAFAWNPSITGTKSEDTILASGSGQEILTPAIDWPLLDHSIRGRPVQRPDILVL